MLVDKFRYLDVVALVVVAALAEQPVVNDIVDVKLIEQRVSVLGIRSAWNQPLRKGLLTFDTEAVKTTTS